MYIRSINAPYLKRLIADEYDRLTWLKCEQEKSALIQRTSVIL